MASLEQPLERNRRVPLYDRAMDDYQIAGVGLVECERLQMRGDCREIETEIDRSVQYGRACDSLRFIYFG